MLPSRFDCGSELLPCRCKWQRLCLIIRDDTLRALSESQPRNDRQAEVLRVHISAQPSFIQGLWLLWRFNFLFDVAIDPLKVPIAWLVLRTIVPRELLPVFVDKRVHDVYCVVELELGASFDVLPERARAEGGQVLGVLGLTGDLDGCGSGYCCRRCVNLACPRKQLSLDLFPLLRRQKGQNLVFNLRLNLLNLPLTDLGA